MKIAISSVLRIWLTCLSLFFVGAAAGNATEITIRAITSNPMPGAPLPDWAVVNPKGGSTPIQMYRWTLSPPVEQMQGERIRLYDRSALEKALAEKRDLPHAVLELPRPNASIDCMVVVTKVKKEGRECWEGKVYDRSLERYPAGSRLFLNVTPYRITGNCADAPIELGPHSDGIVKPKLSTGDGNYQAPVKVMVEMAGRMAPVANGNWSFLPRTRSVMLIFQVGPAIRMIDIPEELPREEPANTKALL